MRLFVDKRFRERCLDLASPRIKYEKDFPMTGKICPNSRLTTKDNPDDTHCS